MATITKTIGLSADYSTIQAWADDLDNGAIYSASDDAVGEIQAGTYVEDVSITKGGTIGLTSITLQADSSSHHDGTAGSGVVVKTSITIATAVPCAVKWIEVDANGGTPGSATGACFNLTTATTNNTFTGFYNCIAHNANRVGGSIYGGYAINGGNFYNCIVYDLTLDTGSGALVGLLLRGGTAYANKALNCTVHDITQTRVAGTGDVFGIQAFNDNSSNPELIRNCLVTDVVNSGSGSTSCIQGGTTYNTIDYNATSDGSGDITSIVTADQYVSSSGSIDLHLKSGSDCIGAGVDLGTTPTGVQFDIDGRDRDTELDTWDIGADQFVVSSSTYNETGSGGIEAAGSAVVTSKTTTVVVPDGDGTINNWTDQSFGTSNLYATVDEGTDTPNDSDSLFCNVATDALFLTLEDMPAGFETAESVSVSIRVRRTSGKGDFIGFNSVQLFESDETTALTDAASVSESTTLATYTVNPTITGNTDKTSWDGAKIKLLTGTGTTGGVTVTALQVSITHTTGVATNTYTETGSGGIEAGGTSELTVDYNQSTSGGVELAGSSLVGGSVTYVGSGGAELAGTASLTSIANEGVDDVFDTFDGPYNLLVNHEADNGLPWDGDTVTLEVISNQLSAALGGVNKAYQNFGTADGGYQIEVSGSTYTRAGLMFRFQDINNYWIATIKPSSSELELYRNVSGTLTLVDSTTLILESTLTIGVSLSGNTIIVTCGGSTIETTSSYLNDKTKHGVYVNGSSGSATFNNFAPLHVIGGLQAAGEADFYKLSPLRSKMPIEGGGTAAPIVIYEITADGGLVCAGVSDNETKYYINTPYDTFTDTNGTSLDDHVSDCGQDWFGDTVYFEIQDNELDFLSSGIKIVWMDLLNKDFAYQVDLLDNGATRLGMVFRVVDKNNLWAASYANGTLELWRRVGSTWSLRDSLAVIVDTEDYFTLTVVTDGSNIFASIGETIISVEDSTFSTATGAGVWCNGQTGTATFDNFVQLNPVFGGIEGGGGAVYGVQKDVSAGGGGKAGGLSPVDVQVNVGGGAELSGGAVDSVLIGVGGGATLGGSVAPLVLQNIVASGGALLGNGSFPNGYNFRYPVTVGAVSQPLWKFPLLIQLDLSGYDNFLLTDESGNPLESEIREDNGLQTCLVGKVDLQTTEQTLYVYCGD